MDNLVVQVRRTIEARANGAERNGNHGEAHAPDPNLLSGLNQDVVAAIENIGECPPAPTTVRGRLGSLVVQLVKRAIWWYGYYVREAFSAMQRRNVEADRQLIWIIERIKESEQRLAALQREVEDTASSVRVTRVHMDRRVEELEASQLRTQSSQLGTVHEIDLEQLTARIAALETTAQIIESAALRQSVAGNLGEQMRADMKTKLDAAYERGIAAESALNELRSGLNSLQENLEKHLATPGIPPPVDSITPQLIDEINRLKAIVESDTNLSQFTAEIRSSLEHVQNHVKSHQVKLERETEAREVLNTLFGTNIERLDREIGEVRENTSAALNGQLSILTRRLTEVGYDLQRQRSEMSLQDSRLTLFIEEARKRLPEPLSESQISRIVQHPNPHHDAMYVAFQDAFRGSRTEIKRRQEVYLPLLQQAGIGTPQMPVLDLGCGRGEFLEVLKENGLHGYGVDTNTTMLNLCNGMGLRAEEGDALTYLRGVPEGSLGGLTSFHLIEHLVFDDILSLVDEALRVLKPGGCLILETPNPHNVLVGASTFHLDPTHIKPVASPTLRFFVEARGFTRVEVKELHPYDPSVQLPDDASGIGQRLNHYLYGPQDYSVIAFRP